MIIILRIVLEIVMMDMDMFKILTNHISKVFIKMENPFPFVWLMINCGITYFMIN